jgi:DNA-binding FadR family transcriptional regulator
MNALNPFQQQTTTKALANTDQNRAIAEVQAAMIVARSNPRNQVEAMDRILNACTRSSLAATAIYSYARGGTDITGPTIRLAETIAQAWGNVNFGVREIEQREGESTVQSYCWDVETNTRREVTFQVSHYRHTKQGKKLLTDPRDIYEAVANQGARRLRACILAVIPGDVVEAAVNQCETTLHATADVTPDGVKKLVDAFAAIGVTKEQLEARIQRRIDSIQPAQVVAIRKIYVSIKDGLSTKDEWFDDIKPKTKSVDDLLNPPKVVDITTGEVYSVPEDELPFIEPQPEAKTMEKADRYTLGKLLVSIGEAKSQAELDALNPIIETLDKKSSDTAKTAHVKRAAVLAKESNKPVERDIGLEILACQDKQSLLDIIDTLTDVEDKKYRALIDERLDYLRD